jgi:hypothetical protein
MKLSFVILSLLVIHLAAQCKLVFIKPMMLSLLSAGPQDTANTSPTVTGVATPEYLLSGTGKRLYYCRRSFTIHGFWPGPRSSQSFGSFDRKAIASLESKLKTSWPPRAEKARGSKPTYNEAYFLWIHEWEKHGKDFASQALHLLGAKTFPSKIPQRNLALQNRYFKDTLSLFQRIKATRLPRNPTTKKELADLLRIPENSFSTRCLPSGNLQELQICVSVSKLGVTLRYNVVPCKKLKSNCPGAAVKLRDFR